MHAYVRVHARSFQYVSNRHQRLTTRPRSGQFARPRPRRNNARRFPPKLRPAARRSAAPDDRRHRLPRRPPPQHSPCCRTCTGAPQARQSAGAPHPSASPATRHAAPRVLSRAGAVLVRRRPPPVRAPYSGAARVRRRPQRERVRERLLPRAAGERARRAAPIPPPPRTKLHPYRPIASSCHWKAHVTGESLWCWRGQTGSAVATAATMAAVHRRFVDELGDSASLCALDLASGASPPPPPASYSVRSRVPCANTRPRRAADACSPVAEASTAGGSGAHGSGAANEDKAALLDYIYRSQIGCATSVRTAFGERRVTFADYTVRHAPSAPPACVLALVSAGPGGPAESMPGQAPRRSC